MQPKLLLSKVDGRFLPDIVEEEVNRRWLVCEDLVQQLVVKTVRRMKEGRVNDLDDYVNRLQLWLEAQAWDGWKVTSAEASLDAGPDSETGRKAKSAQVKPYETWSHMGSRQFSATYDTYY